MHSDIIFSPIQFLEVISAVYDYGMWAVFGIQFKGLALVLVWFCEAIILFLVSYFLIRNRNLPPFSDKLNRWYPKYNLRQFFEYMVVLNKFKQEMETDYMKAIEELGKGMQNRFWQISVYYLKEEAEAYLTFTNIGIEQQGRGKKNEETIIHTLKISADNAEKLIQKYGKEKEFFLDH